MKELVRKFHPEVFIVLETHTQFNKVKSFWEQLGYIAVDVAEATGHFGGIWVLNTSKTFQVSVVDIFISVSR